MKKFTLGILIALWLGFWVIFSQNNILPDDAQISVKDPLIMWEATNLKITMMKNWAKMNTYNGTIWMFITEEDWKMLNDNEYTIPSRWMYTFLWSDLWEKEFQRWLEIKKEWTFYIEIQDLNDPEDRALWRQLVHVIRNDTQQWNYHIDILSPISDSTVPGEKIEVIATVPELPNSQALIYIDDNNVWVTNTDSQWTINHTVWSVTPWRHNVRVEIPDIEWNILGTSDKVYFTSTISEDNWIKDVQVDPEKWLLVHDMVTIRVLTDEMIESVKMRLSDRPENEAFVMNKDWIWEFSQSVFLVASWEVSISLETSSSNNSLNKTYDDVKKFKVWDMPKIINVKTELDMENRTADITWEIENGEASSYLVNYWFDWTNLSGEEWRDTESVLFENVPYESTWNVTITPYWDNLSKHWVASKTVQFVISKTGWSNVCWDWKLDYGESCDVCPQDCQDTWVKVSLSSTCMVQNISTHTEKIGDSYYLVWDKVDNVSKYIIYSSTRPDWSDKVKVYETTDTSYEYPFDKNAEEDIFLYFWIVWICDDGMQLELTWATKVQVWPAENFFLLLCLTLLIYSWIKLFRQTEE